MNTMKLIDMHCDTLGALLMAENDPKYKENGEPLPSLLRSSFHIDLEKLKKSNYLLQNFAVFIFLKEGKILWKTPYI